MTKIRLGLSALAAIAILAVSGVVGGGAGPASAQEATPTPVTTGNIPLVAISPALCFPLVTLKFDSLIVGAAHASNCNLLDSRLATTDSNGHPSTQGHDALMDLEAAIGNNDGILEPSDFAGIDLDGNQIHQRDDDGNGTSAYNGNLLILAFVSTPAPVRFKTNVGLMIPAGLKAPGQDLNTNPADPAGQTYVCDGQSGSTSGPLVEDADCTGGSNMDGVVVGRLRAHWGTTTADLGPGTVTVNQGSSDEATIAFRVVGEPHSISFTTLENTIQDGVTDPADCPLPLDAAGFLGANGTAERSIVLGIAKDIEGNAVTGVAIEWETDDPNKANMAASLTPTLDLGAFGFGAPNIICGNTDPGTVTVRATIHTDLSGLVTTFDPMASTDSDTTQFTVVGLPAAVTLAAAPSAIPCDGTATSTVSATVLDAEGTPATSGLEVHFDVQVLGTANPIIAKTNGDGVATSTITPLAINETGVPVVVTAGDVQTSLLVNCSGAAAPPPPPPAGGAPGGGAAGGGTGVIIGPNTGTGALAGSGAGVPAWAYALLALGAVALSAGSMVAGARMKDR